jgi:uncharacterized protein (TIGR02246 family)
MPVAPEDIISRYFAAQIKRDTDALVALFTDGAVVVDEGQTRRGTNEIRAWRDEVATTYQYTTEVLDVQPVGDGDYLARVRLEGNFPGGIVELRHRFTIDGDRISRLEIAP